MSDMIYEWKLRIIQDELELGDILIGIVSDVVGDKFIGCEKECEYYILFHRCKRERASNHWEVYDVSIKQGDQVIMHLNVKQAQIKLIFNGEEGSIAFTDIKKTKEIKYRLFASLYTKVNCV